MTTIDIVAVSMQSRPKQSLVRNVEPKNGRVDNSGASGLKQRELIERLLADKSVATLVDLLHSQSSTVPIVRRIEATHPWGNIDVQDPIGAGFVNGISRVNSAGNQYVIATAAVGNGGDQFKSGSHGAVCVFKDTGELVGTIEAGGKKRGLESEIIVTNLGSEKDWFALVTRYEADRGFDVTTEIYRINSSLTLLATVLHWTNDVSLPILRGKGYAPLECEPSPIGRPYILMMGQRKSLRPPQIGIDQDGFQAIPEIAWVESEEVLVGPSTLKYNGSPVFEIDMEHSPGFQARSTPDWSGFPGAQ